MPLLLQWLRLSNASCTMFTCWAEEHHPELRSLNSWNAAVPRDSDHEKLTTNQILAARQNIKSHFELGVDPAGSVTFAQESSMSCPSIVWHIQAHMALCTHVHRVCSISILLWLVLERYWCCVHGLQRTICNTCEPWQHVPSSEAAQPHWENLILVLQNAPQTNNWSMFGAFIVLLMQTERVSKMWRSHKTTVFR